MGQKINERDIKPTFDKPKSNQAINFQDKFNKTMLKNNVHLDEVDSLLTEKEESLKKKIFSLGKAEALIHSDPKLSAIYDKMSEYGKEKYGYHYNETIINIIFNDYVLNDARYLQKYKQAIPKEKKRRDKSGINALKKSGKELEKKRQNYEDRMSGKIKENLNETNSSGSGSYNTPLSFKDDVKNVSKEIDTEAEKKKLKKVEVVFPGKERHAYDNVSYVGDDVSSAVAKPDVNQDVKKPYYPGGKITAPILNDVNINTLKPPKRGENKPEYNINENIEQMNKDKEVDVEKTDDQIEETTSAAAGATGSGGVADYTYVGPAAWGSGDLAKGKKTKKDKESFWKGGKVIQESDYLTSPDGFEKYIELLNEQDDIDYIRKNSEAYGSLDNMNPNDINIIKKDISTGRMDEDHAKTRDEKMDVILQYLNSQDDGILVNAEDLNALSDVALDQTYADIERLMGMYEGQLNEKAKSKAQQRFMGMVHAYQKGELDGKVSPAIKKAAASMSDKDAEDFASTKHKGLPDHVDEENGGLGQAMGDRVADKFGLEEDHMKTTEDQLEFILSAWEQISPQNMFNKDIQREIWGSLPPNKIKMFYDTTEKMLKDRGIDPRSISIRESAIENQEDSMKMKPPIGNDGGMGDFPTGMQIASTGGLNENKKNNDIMKDSEKYLNEADKELNLLKMHHNKLKEERKPSTLVMKDRLGNENEQNFKKDLKHSGTKEIIDVTKELEWKDQQTDVPKDPQKLGKDIEKQALKNTDNGTALKNVGNSTNNDGDEIPKRNLTDEEANEVDLYRKGLSDVVFDNKPDERFEERMKRDMGDKIYKERQQTMDLEAEAPMYNKDTQPYQKGIKKNQFDKEKTGWNDRLGINEAVVTGKYKDKYGKTKFHDFDLKNVKEINEIKQVNLIPLNLVGMGNTYSNKVKMNESVSKVINDWNFYLFEGNVVAHKPVKKLNESEEKEKKNVVNEQFSKMQHLLGYKPNDFIDSKKTKL